MRHRRARPGLWREIADGLVLPRDRRRGAILNHDGARLEDPRAASRRERPDCSRSDIDRSEREELATYRYAAVEQAPLYVGAPMLSALLPVFAARAGEPALARSSSRAGYGDFINEPFLEPDEYPRSRNDRPRASPMFANLSGYLTGVLYGFTGLQIGHDEPGAWSRHPVRMPSEWRAVRIGRLWIRGRPWALEARAADDSCRLTPLDGDGMDAPPGLPGQAGP